MLVVPREIFPLSFCAKRFYALMGDEEADDLSDTEEPLKETDDDDNGETLVIKR